MSAPPTNSRMFEKILIANRGEIACRIMRTCRRLGIGTVAVYSDADSRALHVQHADEAVNIGPPPASESYIAIENLLDAIACSGADAVHPGYGFLSENSDFANSLEREGVAFIGPPASAIDAMGDKIMSKSIAARAGVSTVPGHDGEIEGPERAAEIAREIGYPIMIKASAGGGGKGMRIAHSEEDLVPGLQAARNEARSSFGDDRVLFEKFVTRPRHIEIQVLADKFGNCIHLNERECSIQRRNQKVIEEAPSPFLDKATRDAMGRQAVELAKAVGYCSAGTVEFIVDEHRRFYFLEMNTRLQVEHPVTELITGLDLVELMIRVAAGERLQVRQEDVGIDGWAMESRIYAEDPFRQFLPSIGRLTRYRPPSEYSEVRSAVRNDTGVYEGGEISIHYDPMIAKLATWGTDRRSAVNVMRQALDRFEIEGISSNLPFLSEVMDNKVFVGGDLTTAFIDEQFPGGFTSAEPTEALSRKLCAVAAVIHDCLEARRRSLGGGRKETRQGRSWVAKLASRHFNLQVSGDAAAYECRFGDDEAIDIASDWRPGDCLSEFMVDGEPMVLKVSSVTAGYRIRHRGMDVLIAVRTPRQAELENIVALDAGNIEVGQLLCPMPGVVVSFAVAEGESVTAGEPLCTVEAMKMENVLKAERDVTVKRILPSVGDTLTVDAVIMEFE